MTTMTTTMDRQTRIRSAADLGVMVRGLRPDAADWGVMITDRWCVDQMHDLGISRYEDLDADTIGAIADRVDGGIAAITAMGSVDPAEAEAQAAINRSISHTEIVHLEYDSAVAHYLNVDADDSVETDTETEYLGTRDGQEWRVHMARLVAVR